MKRLIKQEKLKYIPQLGDQVKWKRHPYDNSIYEVKQILPNGNVFMDNGLQAFTDIKPSVIKLAE